MKEPGRDTSVLVVDDEESIRQAIRDTLSTGHRVETAGSAEEGLAMLRKEIFDVVLCDIRLPGMDGLTLLDRIRTEDPSTAVIMITAYASVETAVRALKAGAYEYLVKPFGPDDIRKIVRRAVETRRLHVENDTWRTVAAGPNGAETYVGGTAAMKRLYEAAARVAGTDAPVFIHGESGSGKEYLARFIHSKSQRSRRPFVAVNCATFSETLMTSEVFGHARGAFTGAVSDRRGYLELADGGTLLLDEIGELRPELQARLLRALEERTLTRLGSERPIPVDVRYIAAAQAKPEDLIRERKLREDLYFRLSVVTLEIPPLRERPTDIERLASHLLGVLRREMKKDVGPLSPDAVAVLESHSWPGNVRELRNVLERAVIFAKPGEAIEPRHLPAQIRGLDGTGGPFVVEGTQLDTLDEISKRYARHVLDLCQDNRAKAARILGVAPSTLWRWERQAGNGNKPSAT